MKKLRIVPAETAMDFMGKRLIVFAFSVDRFFSADNLMTVLRQSAIIGVMALVDIMVELLLDGASCLIRGEEGIAVTDDPCLPLVW